METATFVAVFYPGHLTQLRVILQHISIKSYDFEISQLRVTYLLLNFY